MRVGVGQKFLEGGIAVGQLAISFDLVILTHTARRLQIHVSKLQGKISSKHKGQWEVSFFFFTFFILPNTPCALQICSQTLTLFQIFKDALGFVFPRYISFP